MTSTPSSPKLPDLTAYDHPDFVGGMVWTELEMRAIKRYAQASIQALEAEVAGLRESATRPSNAVLVPSSELRKLQEDAARYRWLRDGPEEWEMFDSRWLIKVDVYGCPTNELDAAIDAARAAQEVKP
jgi:hypothetical protein